ncbi:MAG: RecX family transcriptional regulator [Clostridia bacterium]|nr:RecX family transcriptional regulator [Clostridia bacterium]
MEFMSKEKFEEAEKIEKLRNKMLKYIVYKKRTEAEIRQKFEEEDENMVEDAIEYFKELKYIDDSVYVERAIKEYIALRNLSIKEIAYKVCQKGVSKSLVDDYICKNKETMLEYEISSAKNIIKKKAGQEEQEIKNFLYKKGFMSESVNIAFDELED